MNRDHSQELAQDLAEARKKKKKSRDSPKTPPGSPPHQPPPPPLPTGPSGALGAPGASGSSQVPPPPPPPSSINQENLEIDEDMAPDEQPQSSDDEDIGKPAWSIPSSDVPVLTNNWASSLESNYSSPPKDSLLTQTGDIATFMNWFYKRRGMTKLKPQDLEGPTFEIVKVFHPDVIHLQYQIEECHKLLSDSVDDPILRHKVSKPLPLGGLPGQVTIQSDLFFNKDLEYLRYGSKGSRPALSISKMKAAYYLDAGLEQMMMMRFNEIHKFSDGTLQQIDEALDYRVKEFRINRMNPCLNTRFWSRKDVDQSKLISFDYKLLDENHVLLRVPRENNMYNVDLKNVVPSGDPLGKFDGKADEGFLVGYSVNYKAFRLFNSRTRIVQETLHIIFVENKPNVAGIEPKWLFDINTLTMSMNYQPGNQPNDHVGIKENLNAGKVGKEIVSAQQYVLLPLWSIGLRDPHNINDDVADAAFDVKKNENDVYFSANGSDKTDNKKRNEKAKRDDKGKSHVDSLIGVRDLRAEFEEFSFSSTNRVNAVNAPVNAVGPNPTNSTNSFNIANPSVTAVSLNFRITGKSSFVDPSKYLDDPDMPELEDIVYSDTKMLMDVKSALLYETIEEEIYVCQPLGFEDPDYPDKVYKVALFIKKQKGDIFLVQVYVDDIIFGSTNREICKAFKKLMKDKFQMSSMGELTFFLGLQVKKKDDEIFISQDKIIAEILRKFGFTDVKSASTPIKIEKLLLKDPDGKDVNVYIYRSMIKSLMYLTSFRPDIMFVVCACVRFQLTPKVSHLHAVKRIFRYLKGKPHLGLWYPRDFPFNPVVYFDIDYAGASLDKKSTIGGCQFLGCRLISWQCKKQTVIATSLTKAEYVAVAICYAQVL
uniref:Uncharacterized protein n=1 Tax=Tanacetum cinerariifolium TaxID=118510 RepID=A0A6L2N1I8_TANCI|nr:hypothetical protein [Tanacetum cinerariifolium]